MDSPHLLRLGLLLVPLAALCPSIAMSRAGPAEGTQDTSSGNTTVTVYHCKDCESSICNSGPISFVKFHKIAETQKRIFSNGIIELETTETHITVCFERSNYFSEGICGIFWEKAGGAGRSCGILNSEESGRGKISAEDKKICCETETNIWKRSPTLKCYIQKSGPKPTTLPADIMDEQIPGIAMSRAGPAEGTQNTSSGNTTVTVYHCKACESSRCNSGPISFEKFEKIAETKERKFSNGIIELETTETHITVCFEQRNYFPEGICGIFWEKTGGAGRSCGILNSGESGRGNISAEEQNICCETETDVWKHNPTLKCYAQKPRPKPTTPPADIPDEGIPGNPEFTTGKNNSTGTLFAFLFVAFLSGMGIMYYCLRQRRGQAPRHDRVASDRENLMYA